MKNSKLFPLFLALGSIITACGGTGGGNTGDSRIIKVWMNEGNTFDGSKKDQVWKKIEEKTNTTLDITGATHGTTYYQTLNPKLSSSRNDLDIIFSVPSNPNCAYENLIDQDMYWNIEELLTKKPGVYKNIEAIIHSDVFKNIVYGDNYHSIIPYLTSRSGWAIYYRADWLINIGYYTEVEGTKVARTPVTMEEFQDVMEKFTTGDPDQNDKNDTYAISPAGSYFYWNPLYHAFGVTPDYDLDQNGDATYMYTQPEFRNFLSWASDMYAKGYVDPQFSANSPNEGDRNKFYNGQVGILITNGESHVEWIVPGVEKIQGKDKVVVGTAPIGTSKVGKEGSSGFSDWGGWWGGYSIFKHMNGKDYDYDSAYAALDVLDYLYSKEGGLLRTYGIQGVHWDYENEIIIPNLANRNEERDNTFYAVEDENGYKKLTGLYEMGSAWGPRVIWDNDKEFHASLDDSNIPYNLKGMYNETIVKNTIKTSKLVNFTGFASGFASQMNLFENEMDRYANAVTTGKESVDNWEDELNKLNTNYSWNKIQAMIKEQVGKAGIK